MVTLVFVDGIFVSLLLMVCEAGVQSTVMHMTPCKRGTGTPCKPKRVLGQSSCSELIQDSAGDCGCLGDVNHAGIPYPAPTQQASKPIHGDGPHRLQLGKVCECKKTRETQSRKEIALRLTSRLTVFYRRIRAVWRQYFKCVYDHGKSFSSGTHRYCRWIRL